MTKKEFNNLKAGDVIQWESVLEGRFDYFIFLEHDGLKFDCFCLSNLEKLKLYKPTWRGGYLFIKNIGK